ncbi:MAG: methyltransferase domain-containing protein [Thermomicrobiales bacterium]
MIGEGLRAEVEHEIAHPRAGVLAAVAALGLRPGQRVLDVGCGPGAHLGLLAGAVSPGGSVVGIDLDAGRVAFATERWADSSTIAVREGDHGALPFADGSFDVAWASLVLHHAERPLAMLGELRRVVRPGGLVAIVEGDTGGSFPTLPWPPDLEIALRRAAWEGARANHDGTLEYHYAGYIGRELPRLLREAGLAEVRVVACPDVDRAPLHPQRAAEIRAGSPGRSRVACAISCRRANWRECWPSSNPIRLPTCSPVQTSSWCAPGCWRSGGFEAALPLHATVGAGRVAIATRAARLSGQQGGRSAWSRRRASGWPRWHRWRTGR